MLKISDYYRHVKRRGEPFYSSVSRYAIYEFNKVNKYIHILYFIYQKGFFSFFNRKNVAIFSCSIVCVCKYTRILIYNLFDTYVHMYTYISKEFRVNYRTLTILSQSVLEDFSGFFLTCYNIISSYI